MGWNGAPTAPTAQSTSRRLRRDWRRHSGQYYLCDSGAHVAAVARTIKGLAELDAAIRGSGGTATLMPLDMKSRDGIVALAKEIDQHFGRLDVMVANAGILGTGTPLPSLVETGKVYEFRQKKWLSLKPPACRH